MSVTLAPCVIWDNQAIVAGVPLVSPVINLPLNRNRLTLLAYASVAATLSLRTKIGSTWREFQSVPVAAATPTPVEIYYAIGELEVIANAAVGGVIDLTSGVTQTHP